MNTKLEFKKIYQNIMYGMSYGKKLNELDRQVERFGVDYDFCTELCVLAQKIANKYPIGNDDLKNCISRFQENEKMFIRLRDVCRNHLENYTHVIVKNDDSTSGDTSHHS